ncbi:MAG: hypothetical protein HQL54_10285 [Magnetococcales bacterium]|nr:hypothetical protein [Magnetococcales bacterium]
MKHTVGIRARLYGVMLVGGIMTFLVGLFALFQLLLINDEMNRVSSSYLPMVLQLTEIQQNQTKQEKILDHLLLLPPYGNTEKTALKETYQTLENNKQAAYETSVELGRLLLAGEKIGSQKEAIKQIINQLNEIKHHLIEIRTTSEHYFSSFPLETSQDTTSDTTTLKTQHHHLAIQLEQLLLHLEKTTQKSLQLSEQAEKNAINWFVGLLIAALMLGYILSTLLSNSILSSLKYASKLADNISQGNYMVDQNVTIPSNEMGTLLESMVNMAHSLETSQIALKKESLELTRSNQELQQFAYVASHDLQEPLRAVASFAQLLEENYKDQLDEDANEFIDYIVNGAQQMQHLINDLLTYSRVHTQAKPLEPVSLNTVFEDILRRLRLLIHESNTVISVQNSLPMVMADEVQLGQVIQNLISNAIKFRSDLTPDIQITVTEVHNRYQISITDNGIGIDPRYKDRIFEIFQRLHTRDEYSGTGIGLAVCKRIIERHGSDIDVRSKLGEGSTFLFSLAKTDIMS